MSTLTAAYRSVDPMQNRIVLLLKWACVLMFLARGYQHLVWDAPFRAILWDPGYMQGWVERFANMTWDEYTTDLQVDQRIKGLIRGFGVFYVLCGVGAAFFGPRRRWLRWLLYAGSAGLLLLAFMYCKEKFYHTGQFFEYALQWSFPLFWVWFGLGRANGRAVRNLLRVAIALTFAGHGMYALGIYPVPGHFVDMTIRSLGLTEPQALIYLQVAGYLDFAVAVGIFLPVVDRYLLIYAAIWGGLTAAARIVAHFEMDFPGETLAAWTHETVYRIPHAVGPLLLLWLLPKRSVAVGSEPELKT
ncbi:MAG: hypothetical protein AAGN35_09975 [Bacteroidota bacterium]